MARKVEDTYPKISIVIGGEVPKFTAYKMSREEAWAARDEMLEIINTVVRRMTKRQLDVEVEICEEAVCEHCNWRWTEKSSAYNGGCCEADERANPLAPAPGDHWSDCATHNEPAMPNGPCDCGALAKQDA